MSLEAAERGPEVSHQLALLITGIPLAYWIDLGFVQGLDKHAWMWRIPLAMQSCFAIFSATLLMMLPDTPRWYYARAREAEGDRVLARLHGLPVEHESVQFVKAEIRASLEEEDGTGKISLVLLFWDNTELQFGRRLRTSFLINWVSTIVISGIIPKLYIDIGFRLTKSIGTTILGHQHAGLLFHDHLSQLELLADAFWCLGRSVEYGFRHCIIPPNLVH